MINFFVLTNLAKKLVIELCRLDNANSDKPETEISDNNVIHAKPELARGFEVDDRSFRLGDRNRYLLFLNRCPNKPEMIRQRNVLGLDF